MLKVSMEKLGANIRRIREEKGWSIEELAEKTGASADYLKKAEEGKRRITIYAVMTLCDAFDIESSELLDKGIFGEIRRNSDISVTRMYHLTQSYCMHGGHMLCFHHPKKR